MVGNNDFQNMERHILKKEMVIMAKEIIIAMVEKLLKEGKSILITEQGYAFLSQK